MFRSNFKFNKLQKEQLKILWLELFEDETREKRLDNIWNNYEKTWSGNYFDKMKICDEPFSDQELDFFKKFETKIVVALSFDQFIDEQDIIDAVYGKL